MDKQTKLMIFHSIFYGIFGIIIISYQLSSPWHIVLVAAALFGIFTSLVETYIL